MVVFFAPQVRDVATGQIVAGLVGQTVTIVYPGTSDPVEITEYPSGIAIPGSVLTVGDTFSLTSFNTPEGVYAVEALASNGARAYLESAEGSRVAAEAAALSAAEAITDSQEAQQAAEQAASAAASLAAGVVRSVNGTTPDENGNVVVSGGGGGGVTDHGALSGLSDDDHPQYHTDARGDARYYRKSEVDALTAAAATQTSAADRQRSNHTGTQAIGTVSGLQDALNGKADSTHTHSGGDITTGTIDPARLGSGSTGGSTRYLREDGTWSVPPAGEGGGIASVNDVGPDGEGNVELTKADIGLGNVDNTSDANKPISTATQAALDGKLASPGPGSSSRMVGVDASGATTTVLRGSGLGANLIVQRDGNGQVNLPEVPTANNHGASKIYVDQAVAAKADDGAVVKLTGSQTIAGVKTFSSAPVVPDAAFPQSKINGLTAALAGKVESSTVTTIWTGSQSAYDAISPKDANTLYLVTE